jgi:CRP-like cAMP-binding protein
MAVIVDGSVEIFDPEHDRSIAIIGKGSFFGEQAILQGGVRAASVRAVDHVTCLEIKTEKLRSLLSEDSGLLMPSIEALLLQLCMANGITRAAEKPADERRFAVISESRISGVEVRKLLNEAYADENRNGFSSDQMLYLKLHASNKLHTVPFSDGQKLGVLGGEHPGAAYVVIEGEVEAEKDNYRVRLGLGSVIGLAEGFSNIPLCMTFSAIGHVTALILPMDQVLRGLQRTNPGIKAIVRYTAARIIDLEKSL